ncbi:hypothetical protein [Nocardioides sp. WS12]|uniref:hypothetical protein n=1 Tax=Nocardioides sp. WS12 TaxID=2486272 RepID=UPI0015FD192B|nr:hypothetical protein [Nocardioides sp. WS12]
MSVTRCARIGAAVAVTALLALLVSWRVDGGRWVHVESPSMGPAAPVGSLLWVAPVDTDTLVEGDFITFRPPGSDALYSHRVLATYDDGSFTTKGDIPGPDPWRLTAADIVGEVRMTWWGVGWLVVAAPVLLGGLAVVAMARASAPPNWRLPVTMVLASTTVSIAVAVYHPLIGAERIAFAPDGSTARATYVGTGLLPVRLSTREGESVLLSSGEVGTVVVREPDEDGRLEVTIEPAVPTWWWAVLVLGCLAPAAVRTVADKQPREGAPAESH